MVVRYNFCDARSKDAAIIMKITNKITFVMVMNLTPNLEETTVHVIDMKCFLIGSSIMCFCHLTFCHFRRFKMSSIIFRRFKSKEQ